MSDFFEVVKMDYQDSNPENRVFVDEIHQRDDFNNMGQHLPKGFYRGFFKKDKVLEEYTPLWNTIDAFINETGFAEDEYWKAFDQGKIGRLESQLMLCPMYVHLRKEGFDEEFITN